MPRLPDIPIQSWLEDQQKRFHEATDGLFPALDFELGAKSTESQIPPDYNAPGGMDQWKEAEQKLLEEQYRKQQQDAEVERQRQEQELAAQYAQQQQQAEAAQAQQQQRDESSVMDQIRGLGIPTPSDAFASFQPQGDHTSTSGALDLPYDARQVDQGAHEASPPVLTAPVSPVDQFNAHAQGLMTDAFGAPTPDPRTLPPPDHTSTTGLLDQIGSGVGSAASAANSALTSLGQSARQGASDLGSALESSPGYQAATRGLQAVVPAVIPGAQDVRGPVETARTVSQAGDYLIENYGAGHQIKAFNEGTADIPGLVMGASGTMGGGGLAQDAIAAIRALRAAGLVDEAVLVERGLAEKTSMTLAEIQQKTQGLVEQVAAPLATEAPAEAASLVGARDPGVTVPSAPPESQLPRLSENTTPPGPETARGMPPEQAAAEQVPGFRAGAYESQPRTPGETNWRSEQVVRETTQEARAAVPRLSEASRAQQAAERLGVDPEAIRPVLARNLELDPNTAAIEAEMLGQHVRTVGDAWEAADANLTRVAAEINDLEGSGQAVPQALRLEAAHWTTLGTQINAELKAATTGRARGSSAAGKTLQAQKQGYLGALEVAKAQQIDEVGIAAREAGDEILKSRKAGTAAPDLLKKVRELGRKLGSASTRKAVAEGEEGAASAGGGRGGTRTGAGPAGPPPAPREETLAEKLGRLKREQGKLEGADTPRLAEVASEIDDTLAQMREHARTTIEQRLANKRTTLEMTPREVEQIVNEAVGRRVQAKITREETIRQKGYWPKDLVNMGKQVEQGITKYYRDAEKLQKSIDAQIQRRIDGALAQEKNAQARQELRDMAGKAQIFAKALRDAPGELHDLSGQYHEQQFDQILREMSDHSNLGERMANDLRERLWDQVGRATTQAEERDYQAGQRALTEARLRGVQQQIQEALANAHTPGVLQRLDGLYDDIMEISTKAGQKASDKRKAAQQAGILQSGLFAQDADTSQVMRLLKGIDPDNPTQGLKAIYETMGRPSLGKVLQEIPYINMLSSPLTLGKNVSSTVLNGAARFMVQSPLEFLGSLGQTRGQGAAFESLGKTIPEGIGLMGQTWTTGVNPRRLNEQLAKGDYRNLGRENLPAYLESLPGPLKKLGVLGVIQHAISTRGLAATDAMLGHIAYGGAFVEQAQREADRLIRIGGRELGEMRAAGTNIADRVAVKDWIISNPWDFPDVIKAAGKIEDHVLFRGKGQSGFEVGLRQMVAKKVDPGSSADLALNLLIDFVIPFRNVPVNYTKQGVKLLASPVTNTAFYGKALVQGDRQAQGEHFAKAVQGLGTLTLASVWAGNDNLTGIGPKDKGDRDIWLLDHKINSWRAYKDAPWVTYEGTPLAIPFGAVAGAMEEQKYAKKADPNLSEAGSAIKYMQGGFKGGMSGVLSNSLAEGVIRNAQLLLGQTTGEDQLAQSLADIVSRYTPTGVIAPSGMLNFLATITDVVERQTANPRNMDEVPQAFGERVQARIPGALGALGLLNREQLPERANAYGDVVTNERSAVGSGGAALMPVVGGLYQGRGSRPNDPITEQLARGSIGAPQAPEEVPMGRGSLPLTLAEQRQYQILYGQYYREVLEAVNAGHEPMTEREFLYMRTHARARAQRDVLNGISNAELDRRWQDKPPVEIAP